MTAQWRSANTELHQRSAGCVDKHPHTHIWREPAEEMEVLMREWKEAKIVAKHCLLDKAPSQAEVVEQVAIDDVFVPANDFLVEPTGLPHHHNGVAGKQRGHDWMAPWGVDQLGPQGWFC